MNRNLLIACAALLLTASAASAAVIDFETTPAGALPTEDGVLLSTTPYITGGVQVFFGFDFDSNGSIETDAVFEQTGTYPLEPPNAGFSGSSGLDTPDPGFGPQLGNWFLRSPVGGANFGRFVIQYSSSFLVTAASGEIWDIDGNQQLGFTEEYTVQAYDSSSNLLATIISPLGVLDTPIAPLDGQPWVFSFSGLSAGIDHIIVTFTGTKPNGIGLAFNNFNPVGFPIPEPATASLGLVACGLAGCLMRRKTRRAGRITLSAALVACVALVQANTAAASTIVYDNLDPTPTPYLYANYGTWTGNFLPTMYAVSGTTFVPTGSGPLDELSLGMLQGHTYGTQNVALKLSLDVAGYPGAPIFTVNTLAPNAPYGTLLTLTGLAGPTLTAGTTYWLMAETPVDGTTMQNWYANNQGDLGPIISTGTRFAQADRWSLRVGVKGGVIPEPAAAALIGVGAFALMTCRKRLATRVHRS